MSSADVVVHIVDDEEPVRNSLAFLLGSAGFAVRTHSSAAAFLDVAPSVRNGCLVTDLRMPDIDGVELLRRLKAAGTMLPAIVVTGHGDVQMAVEAMKTGAMDFIEKPFSDEVLIDSINRAVAVAASRGDAAAAAARTHERLASLSDRELQVLKRVVQGQANKAIAYELGLSPRTVEVYRAGLMGKMQAKNLAELVRTVIDIDLDQFGGSGPDPS
ncbi:MAG: DNA-binding response regulator [Devosia sp. 67-54]|uniref:response regulator FixJ n=1 Tax=unclassified Devosia TaxID=196773 RepID=UPI0009633870|nr:MULTISPECIES: response regulator FixJ [unclassified Devosia]MBN9305513.1 response regulator [Devosia sp.]OJX19097.1 MAG: DNA-binding response regulator [Devosia sp. 67-54]